MSAMFLFVLPLIYCIYVPTMIILLILRGVDRHSDNLVLLKSGSVWSRADFSFGSGLQVFPNCRPEPERTGPKVLRLPVARCEELWK